MQTFLKTLFITLCLFKTLSCPAALMSESEFTEHFRKQAAAVLKDVKFQVTQPLQVRSRDVNGYELSMFLGNAFAQYKSNPGRLQSIIDSQIQAVRTRHLAASSSKAGSLFAVIKPADYLETVKKQLSQAGLGDKASPFAHEKLNDDLYMFFVFDSENGMRMATKKDLAEIKVEESAARAIAVKNLQAYFDKKGPAIRRLDKTGGAKVYVVSLDENYEASILLLKHYWNKETFDVSGDIVAFVPARNVVVVAGSRDREGMRIASYLARSGFKELGYAISPKGFVYNAGVWKSHEP